LTRVDPQPAQRSCEHREHGCRLSRLRAAAARGGKPSGNCRNPALTPILPARKEGLKMAIERDERRVWAALLSPPGVADVFGASRGSQRLRWTPRQACAEAQDWIEEMPIGPVTWEASILLPRGEPLP
jgi:hypothetical protein